MKMMVLTPYGEVLLRKSAISSITVNVDWIEWPGMQQHARGLKWLSSEGWLEMARGDITVPAEVTEFVKSIE